MKIAAALVIVCHHLSDYGLLGVWLNTTLPTLARLTVDYGAMAVQVFLVAGGYLTATSLMRQAPQGTAQLPRLVARRYLRLVPATLMAVLLAVIANEMARHAGDIPGLTEPSPTWGQVISHVFMVQDILGHAALSAGIWYVAIDLQLYALLALLWCITPTRYLSTCVGLLVLASLLGFNRDAAWSVWAPYFWVSYGLGCLVALRHAANAPTWILTSLLIACAAIGGADGRDRLLLAVVTALLLWWAPRPTLPPVLAGALQAGGAITFSLFLVHYPVLLLANTAVQLGVSGAMAVLIFLLLTSILTLFFHRQIEQPLSRS